MKRVSVVIKNNSSSVVKKSSLHRAQHDRRGFQLRDFFFHRLVLDAYFSLFFWLEAWRPNGSIGITGSDKSMTEFKLTEFFETSATHQFHRLCVELIVKIPPTESLPQRLIRCIPYKATHSTIHLLLDPSSKSSLRRKKTREIARKIYKMTTSRSSRR